MKNTSSVSSVDFLKQLLEEGKHVIGQIFLGDDFSLRHHDDTVVAKSELVFYDRPEAARAIARYDSEGEYRPLKTAPSLKRGWLLQLQNLQEMVLALDFFYPASLSLYQASQQGTLKTTSLRETLNRQTGMYRVTQLLTEEQAEHVITKRCNPQDGCLRHILWSRDLSQKEELLSCAKKNSENIPSEIPLLCREACNLLVAEARSVVKKMKA